MTNYTAGDETMDRDPSVIATTAEQSRQREALRSRRAVTALPVAVARTALRLAAASHPGPSMAVTLFAMVLGAVAGNSVANCAIIGAAVLAGQLSIGWSNDRIDAGRDALANRADKPVAAGLLTTRVIDIAIAVVLMAQVPLSVLLGWPAAAINLFTIACGWAYNLGLKASWWSWAPYALAFGALPAIATTALTDPRPPGLWVLAAGALLGVAANLTNALPDLVDDEQSGVRGLPHRLGATTSLGLAAVLLLAATLCGVFGPANAPAPVAWIGLVIVSGLVAVGLPRALRAPASRASFVGIIAITAIDVLLIVITGGSLR